MGNMKINPDALAAWREERGFTKTFLADEADISLSYYSEIESGIKNPSPAVIQRLADQLKVRLTVLIENPNEAREEVAS